MRPEQRAAWLRERKTGIGGTDIASICGVGWMTPAEVYESKLADPPEREPSAIMQIGLATEQLNAELYTRRTGARLHSPDLMRSPSLPFVFATLDRITDGGTPVELKYASFFGDMWGDDGTDDVRDAYILQAHWQCIVLRHNDVSPTEAHLSALSGQGEHRIYRIQYDAYLADALLRIATAFWTRVEERTGIDNWESPLLETVATHLKAIRPDTSIQLGADAVALANEYEELSTVKRNATVAADRIKSRLVAMMDGHESGTLPDGRRIRQKQITRNGYTVAASTYTDFRILKAKKGNQKDE